MSKHTKKGYRTVRARDPKTGRLFNAAVRVGGKVDKQVNRQMRQAEKARRVHNTALKAKLRELKKTAPLELRAKVNWNSLVRGVVE